MKKNTQLSRLEFFALAVKLPEQVWGVIFTEDGEKVKWYNNYTTLVSASANAKLQGRNSWVYQHERILQPA
jgi:hypothetical protein